MNLPKNKQQYVSWINDIQSDQHDVIGRKANILAKIANNDIPTPKAFIVHSQAFNKVIEENHLLEKIHHQLQNIDAFNPNDISLASDRIMNLIMSSRIPKNIAMQIFEAYYKISDKSFVAIRGSKQDPSGAISHQQPFLGIRGDANVIEHIKKMWANHFSHKYINNYIKTGADITSIGITVIVEHMINSDSSGVIFTQPPDGHNKNYMYIQAVWGIRNEYIDSSPYPDLYTINKETLQITQKEIIDQHICIKQVGEEIKKIDISSDKTSTQKISSKNIINLTKIASRVQKLFFFPQKIEWAQVDNQIYILDSQDLNPNETIAIPQKTNIQSSLNNLRQIASGTSIVPGIVSGPVRIIKQKKDIEKIKPKDIIITNIEYINLIPLRKISGIILNHTSPTNPSSILIKDLGIPSIILENIQAKINPKSIITLNSSTGLVYQGTTPAKTIHIPKNVSANQPQIKTITKLYTNISKLPDEDITLADGVGILRSENLYKKEDLPPPNSPTKQQATFIDKLTKSISKICKEFTSKPVFYRLSDDKSFGLLGIRGVSRHFLLQDIIEIEAKAIIRIKKEHSNLHILLPFVRSSSDISKIKKVLADFDIKRSEGYKFWIMAEVPSCVLSLEKCIDMGIDGVVVGLNDLTMLTLGVDRNEGPLGELYDSNHPSVLSLVKQSVKTCLKKNIPCILAGEDINIHPDIIEEAVKWGVTGLSVSPGFLPITKTYIENSEKRLVGIRK